MPNIKINSTNVSKIKLPLEGGRGFYWDSGDGALKGFGVKATGAGLTYIVKRRIGRGRSAKWTTIKVGSVSAMDADTARKKASEVIRELEEGIDVNAADRSAKKELEVKEFTLGQAYAELKTLKSWRDRTTQTYDENINRTLCDWLDLPLASITPEMIVKKHKQISTMGRNGRGKGSANQAMRIVRLVFNFVMAAKTDGNGQPLITKNPVTILNDKNGGMGAWNKLEERDTTIHADDLKSWCQAVMNLESDKLQDFFLFLMFSGLRRSEAMRLELKHFDTKTKTLTIPAEISKAKKTRKIPLTDVLIDIYRRRKSQHIAGAEPHYVFQGRHGRTHLTEPKSGVLTVRDKSGILWSSHDLRRSYVTIANKLDVSAYKVKFLVGHSVSGDVTGKHYSKLTVDDVRDAAQEIADFLKAKMGMQAVVAEAIGE